MEEFFTYSWQYLLQIPPPTGWPALPHFPTLGSQGGLSNGNTPPPPHRPTRSLWGPARQEKVMGGCTGKGWVCPGGGVAERVNRIGIHPGELKGAGPRQHLGPGQEGPTVAEAGTRAQGPGSEPGFGARLPELLCLWLRPVQGTPGPGTQWALNRPCCPVLSIREEVKGGKQTRTRLWAASGLLQSGATFSLPSISVGLSGRLFTQRGKCVPLRASGLDPRVPVGLVDRDLSASPGPGLPWGTVVPPGSHPHDV